MGNNSMQITEEPGKSSCAYLQIMGGNVPLTGYSVGGVASSLLSISRLANRLARQVLILKGVSQISRISRGGDIKTEIVKNTPYPISHEWCISDNENALSIIVCVERLRTYLEHFNAVRFGLDSG